MSPIEQLEMLARDCEELAIVADDHEGRRRTLLSVAFRIRFAIKGLSALTPADGGKS